MNLHLHFHPMFTSFMKGGQIKTIPKLYHTDGIHPGDRGIDLLNNVFMQLVAQHKRGGLTFVTY